MMRGALASVAVIGFLTGCMGGLDAKTQQNIAHWKDRLPVGSSLAEAEREIKAQSLPYTLFSSRDCEENAKITSPTYTPRGGPCLFALERVGQTWYGYTADLEIRLLFGSTGLLVQRDFDRVDTFI